MDKHDKILIVFFVLIIGLAFAVSTDAFLPTTQVNATLLEKWQGIGIDIENGYQYVTFRAKIQQNNGEIRELNSVAVYDRIHIGRRYTFSIKGIKIVNIVPLTAEKQ